MARALYASPSAGARGLASTLTRELEDVAFGAFGIDQGGLVRVAIRDGELAVEIA